MGILGANIPPLVYVLMIGETVLACVFAATLLWARKHHGRRHHCVTLAAFLVDVLLFKPLMISRAADGSNAYFPWPGSNILIHLTAAGAVTVLGIIVIVIGLRKVIRKEKKMLMPPKGKRHKTLGYVFLAAWYLTYAIGVVIFLVNWG